MSNFVCSGAKIYCSYGSCTSSLVVLPDRNVDLSVGPMANKVDHTPQKNIFSFGICSYLSAKANHPVKCSPATNSDWCICKEDVLVRNQPALTTDSFCKCQHGGIIKFNDDGQKETSYDTSREPSTLLECGIEKKVEIIGNSKNNVQQTTGEGWGWLDTVELIPVVGSVVGMGRAGVNGNLGMVALNAGFLVADVAGIVSFGSTTAASTAAKASIKAGAKVLAKQTMKASAKEVASTPKLLSLVKPSPKNMFENVPEAYKEYGKKVVDELVENNQKAQSKSIIGKTGGEAKSRMAGRMTEFLDNAKRTAQNKWNEFKTNNEISTYFRNLHGNLQKIESEQKKIEQLKRIYGPSFFD